MKPSSHHRLWPWIAVPIVILITIAGIIGPYSDEFTLATLGLLALYLLRYSTRVLSPGADQDHSFSAPVQISSPRWVPVFGFLITATVLISMNATAVSFPENATAERYGDGWACNPDFREKDGGCEAIVIPENAFADGSTYGSGWSCARGYREVREACVEITVPRNAYLNSSGDRWECERGFRANEASCEPIDVPLNGYLSNKSHGPGWKCNRGFRPVRGDCSAIEVPQNGFLSDVQGLGKGGRVNAGIGKSISRVCRSTCPTTARCQTPGTVPVGNATVATRRFRVAVWQSRCRPMPTSTTEAMVGNAINLSENGKASASRLRRIRSWCPT